MENKKIWNKLISLKEAAEVYNRDTSTIKRAISNKTLVEGVDCKKFGRDWVILKSALDRVYVEERFNRKK